MNGATRPDRRQLLFASAFWVLILGGLAAAAVQVAWRTHQEAAQQIETLEPRIARLAGLGSDRTKLAEGAKALTEQVQRHAYPASRDATQAGNDAQQRARELFARAGLEVASIQVLPPRTSGGFDRIPITLRVDGELAAVQAALATLASASPTLFVEGFSMQGANGAEPAAPRVMAELQLFALRVRP